MKDILRKYNLSPNQYFFLIAIHEQYTPYKITNEEIEDLKSRSYFLEDDMGIHLHGKAKELFSNEDSAKELFKEIWTLYPIRTPNGRVLRPASIDSQMANKIFHKIRKEITKNKNYVQIIKGLKNEIANRSKMKDGLNYMQRLDTWVNQKSWESYQEPEESDEDESVFNIG